MRNLTFGIGDEGGVPDCSSSSNLEIIKEKRTFGPDENRIINKGGVWESVRS
jgi:hypothetical protein